MKAPFHRHATPTKAEHAALLSSPHLPPQTCRRLAAPQPPPPPAAPVVVCLFTCIPQACLVITVCRMSAHNEKNCPPAFARPLPALRALPTLRRPLSDPIPLPTCCPAQRRPPALLIDSGFDCALFPRCAQLLPLWASTAVGFWCCRPPSHRIALARSDQPCSLRHAVTARSRLPFHASLYICRPAMWAE